MLEAHPVDALVDRRDELDEGDWRPVEDAERVREEDLRDRSAVPDVLEVRGRVALEECAQMDVLVPVRDADRQVAQRVRADVDAAREQPLVLHRRESAVVPDDVADRISHRAATLRAIMPRGPRARSTMHTVTRSRALLMPRTFRWRR